ncbi:MAG TPA: TMEM175 family protein [Candidatus Baltobacteraceae bacterium]|nr:TMEM175 family protein [Candidatus Baltobacteraceae bacterium]
MPTHERDERLVHRLESFSDVVIGFSLALLSLTLVIPQHVTELIRNTWWMVAYVWTYAVIASIWYNHQRLFSVYFVVRPYTIVLNFFLLSTLGLMVYFVQVFVHVQSDFDKIWTFLVYFLIQGLSGLAIGVLYSIGVRARWNQLDPHERYVGILHGSRSLIAGASILLGIGVSALRPARTMDDALPLAYAALAGLLLARVGARLLKSRIVGVQTVR